MNPQSSEQPADPEDFAPTVEAYREQFKNAPVGCWHTAVGTFSMVMDVVWNFFPDGTGQYQEYGPFGHPSDESVPFEWRGCEKCTIWFRELNAGEKPDPWFKLRYDFIFVTHDVGSQVAMIEVAEDGTRHEGFGWSIRMFEEPLAYIGPATGIASGGA